MERRKFIELNSWFIGASLLAGGGFASMMSCMRQTETNVSSLLSEGDVLFLNELGEVIIPTTDTPGGKAADVGSYVVLVHNDCLNEEEQKENMTFLEELRAFYKESTGKDFMECSVEERAQATEQLELVKNEPYLRYKYLIVSAFLSSEIGASVFMKYTLVPGRYDGCASERPW